MKEIKPIQNSDYKLYGTSAKVDNVDSEWSENIKDELMMEAAKKAGQLMSTHKIVWGPQFNVVGDNIMCLFLTKKIKRRNKKSTK